MTYYPLIGIPSASLEPSPVPGTRYYRFNGNYPAALAAVGAAPVAIPLELPPEPLRALFDRLDGLCLAGGEDVAPTRYGEAPHPALGSVDFLRDETEIVLARWALATGRPILAICRGIQLLNVAAGGSLYQDIAAQLPEAGRHAFKLAEVGWDRPTHRVCLAAGSRLAAILGTGELGTNSFHHQAVKQPGNGFLTVAWTEDGVIEGIEAANHRFAIGVQWHPEGVFRSDSFSQRLFTAFVEASREKLT
jgi:putative glutamine amidotransferase